jgi:hypothetical protein
MWFDVGMNVTNTRAKTVERAIHAMQLALQNQPSKCRRGRQQGVAASRADFDPPWIHLRDRHITTGSKRVGGRTKNRRASSQSLHERS